MSKTICLSVRARFHPSGGSIHFGAWKRCHPTAGWLTRQHCGDSLKKIRKKKEKRGVFKIFFSFLKLPLFLQSVLHTYKLVCEGSALYNYIIIPKVVVFF